MISIYNPQKWMVDWGICVVHPVSACSPVTFQRVGITSYVPRFFFFLYSTISLWSGRGWDGLLRLNLPQEWEDLGKVNKFGRPLCEKKTTFLVNISFSFSFAFGFWLLLTMSHLWPNWICKFKNPIPFHNQFYKRGPVTTTLKYHMEKKLQSKINSQNII